VPFGSKVQVYWSLVRWLLLTSCNASVSHLAKIGSLTDWDQEQITREIDKIIRGRCKSFVQVLREDVASIE
jgi:hypothetical protein